MPTDHGINCVDCAAGYCEEHGNRKALLLKDRHGPYDAYELVRWAEMYGHPEEWCQKAQQAHARAERAEAERDRYRRAFEMASDAGTSACSDPACASCEETRQQMRDWWLKETANG